MQMFTHGEKQQKNHDLDLMEKSESESKTISSSSKAGSTAVHVQNSYNDSFTESDQTESSTSANSNVSGNRSSENREVTETLLVDDSVPESLESSGEMDQKQEVGGLQREASELTDTSEGSIPSNDGNIYYPFVDKGTFRYKLL